MHITSAFNPSYVKFETKSSQYVYGYVFKLNNSTFLRTHNCIYLYDTPSNYLKAIYPVDPNIFLPAVGWEYAEQEVALSFLS